MKKELNYFNVGASYGGNQEWFSSFMMRIGGCAAETAVECCIYLDKYFGTSLSPFDVNTLTKSDYVRFSEVMKPYLHPRMQGIDSTAIYIDGLGRYLRECGSGITLTSVEGSESYTVAKEIIKAQLDKNLPVPYLCLYHNNPRYKDYEWHWFILNGYCEEEDVFLVKAVTYSAYEWLDLSELWDSGRHKKGGLIVINL